MSENKKTVTGENNAEQKCNFVCGENHVILRLTENHIKLLKHLNFETLPNTSYNDLFCPSINLKRPFGNTGVLRSVCQILEVDEKTLTKEQENKLWELVIELPVALEIVLQQETFIPGMYSVKTTGSWQEYQMKLKYLMMRDTVQRFFDMADVTLDELRLFRMIKTLCQNCTEENPYADVLKRLEFMHMDEIPYVAKCMEILKKKEKEFKKENGRKESE